MVFREVPVSVEYEVRAMGAEPAHGMPGMKM